MTTTRQTKTRDGYKGVEYVFRRITLRDGRLRTNNFTSSCKVGGIDNQTVKVYRFHWFRKVFWM